MPDVVRMLFGSSGGMFECTQEKCEESPNKVSSNTGTRPDRHRIPVAWNAGKIFGSSFLFLGTKKEVAMTSFFTPDTV